MSKKEVSRKNKRLSNIAIIVAVIAITGIALSSNVFITAIILIIALIIFFAITKNMDDVKRK